MLSFKIWNPLRLKGGMSLRNGRWHDARNDIIRNTIYAGNKLTEGRVMFSRQFYKSSRLLDAEDSTEPRQIANKSRIRSYARCLGRSEGEEIDEKRL